MLCRVAAAQIALRKGSYERAIEDAQNLISAASKSAAQIICLPEHWLLEFWEKAGSAIELLAKSAVADRIFVMTGANYTVTSSGIRIRDTLIDPQGRTVGWQDKVHLFNEERTLAAPGEKFEVFETLFGKLGVTVCYDNVFPEAARTLALRGADLLCVPSRIVAEGLDPWLLYLKTRALENRIPVIAPNVYDPPRYPGGSVIIDLEETRTGRVVLPKIAASAQSGETIIVSDIDLDAARTLRSQRLSQRMPATYD